jgi:murein DD-endopeptidase MepM/ murein hydrolase activator NlpD
MKLERSRSRPDPPLSLGERFGLRSLGQVSSDLAELVRDGVRGKRFQFNLRSAAILRPGLSLPAYAGLKPADGMAPIFNLFDRSGGGVRYRQRVSRTTCRDFRGGTLTYDEHDGTDMVCPVGTPLVAAAPGVVVMIRDRWLRGGLTVAVDHGHGMVTQYTHCSRALTEIGQDVQRGEPVALSGASGVDMTQFFPWVAPHIHFMVYVNGRPVDPFLAQGEARRPGTWYHGNQPRTSGPMAGDPARVRPSPVDDEALERLAAACTDATIRAELARAATQGPAALAALLEDALCHDGWAFPAHLHRPHRPHHLHHLHRASVRPTDVPAADAVAITLPLPRQLYRGVRLADTRWSAPG